MVTNEKIEFSLMNREKYFFCILESQWLVIILVTKNFHLINSYNNIRNLLGVFFLKKISTEKYFCDDRHDGDPVDILKKILGTNDLRVQETFFVSIKSRLRRNF